MFSKCNVNSRPKGRQKKKKPIGVKKTLYHLLLLPDHITDCLIN